MEKKVNLKRLSSGVSWTISCVDENTNKLLEELVKLDRRLKTKFGKERIVKTIRRR